MDDCQQLPGAACAPVGDGKRVAEKQQRGSMNAMPKSYHDRRGVGWPTADDAERWNQWYAAQEHWQRREALKARDEQAAADEQKKGAEAAGNYWVEKHLELEQLRTDIAFLQAEDPGGRDVYIMGRFGQGDRIFELCEELGERAFDELIENVNRLWLRQKAKKKDEKTALVEATKLRDRFIGELGSDPARTLFQKIRSDPKARQRIADCVGEFQERYPTTLRVNGLYLGEAACLNLHTLLECYLSGGWEKFLKELRFKPDIGFQRPERLVDPFDLI